MSLSDSEDGISSDNDNKPARRSRADTMEASSTTSQGSMPQDSDDDADQYKTKRPNPKRPCYDYNKESPHKDVRVSRSSMSDNSSSNDQFEEVEVESATIPTPLNVTQSHSEIPSNTYERSLESNSNNKANYSKIDRFMSKMGYKERNIFVPQDSEEEPSGSHIYSTENTNPSSSTSYKEIRTQNEVRLSSFSENSSSNDQFEEVAAPVDHSLKRNAMKLWTNNRPLDSDEEPRAKYAKRTLHSGSDSDSSSNDHLKSNEDTRPYFQDSGDKYNKRSLNEIDDSNQNVENQNKVERMMKKMGYQHGKGLGKREDGITEPIAASTQKGKRGLGLRPSAVGKLPSDFKWTPDEAPPEINRPVTWMPPPPHEPLSGMELNEWLQEGPEKLTLDDEIEFVDPQIMRGILDAKATFDTLDDEHLREARFRSNPYETIGANIFLNRAAVKMANMDASFDYMFTNPKLQNGAPAVDKEKELLYFADVCAGPGGFSEYVLYRRSWTAKGFGFTLSAHNDFKLNDFYAGPSETFNPYYGVDGDGDIFKPNNLASLKEQVLKYTNDKGVHFLMADGGFSVSGQENIQEILSKQLYLTQCLAGLMLVRTGGHFLVKLFDIFTPFSVGLIYIMYRCFEKVSIYKPVTSRPANSERYLICKWKRLGTEPAENHLFSVNCKLCQKKNSAMDVTHLVPLSVLKNDKDFFNYIYNSNFVIGEMQIRNLLKIYQYSKDKSLKDVNQIKVRKECLELWQLPDEVRKQPTQLSADETFTIILSMISKRPLESNIRVLKNDILQKPPLKLKSSNDLKVFKKVYDWYYVFLESGDENKPTTSFFLGNGGSQVYQLDGGVWRKLDLLLYLPAKTLIYGEIVKELDKEGAGQSFTKVLHVIDVLILGGKDVSSLCLTDRILKCDLFCTALYKPFTQKATALRCKRLYNMANFSNDIVNLEFRNMKRIPRALTLKVRNRYSDDEFFYTIGSILFISAVKEPWHTAMSSKMKQIYYYNGQIKNSSVYEINNKILMDVWGAFMTRVIWMWHPSGRIFENLPHSGLTRQEMEDYIQHNLTTP